MEREKKTKAQEINSRSSHAPPVSEVEVVELREE